MGKEFGQRILSAIRISGISQKELAATIGVTEGVISRYVLKVPLSELFE